jgi:hypothetical protein
MVVRWRLTKSSRPVAGQAKPDPEPTLEAVDYRDILQHSS